MPSDPDIDILPPPHTLRLTKTVVAYQQQAEDIGKLQLGARDPSPATDLMSVPTPNYRYDISWCPHQLTQHLRCAQKGKHSRSRHWSDLERSPSRRVGEPKAVDGRSVNMALNDRQPGSCLGQMAVAIRKS